MMKQVNVHEAKTHLSRLLEEVQSGREVVIARAGKPVARLVPVTGEAERRTLGILAGKLAVPADFDAPLPDDVLALSSAAYAAERTTGARRSTAPVHSSSSS
jgi:prevent-host-death family protein